MPLILVIMAIPLIGIVSSKYDHLGTGIIISLVLAAIGFGIEMHKDKKNSDKHNLGDY